MKRSIQLIAATLIVFFCLSSVALATLDQYVGDSAIYGGSPGILRPNVLLIIDNSNAAADTGAGEPYDKTMDYDGSYSRWAIYQLKQSGDPENNPLENSTSALENLTCSNNGNIIKNTLLGTLDGSKGGTYTAAASSDYPSIGNQGGCVTNKAYTYALGNYLNYLNQPPPEGEETQSQAQIVFDAIDTVMWGSRSAINLGAMVYRDEGNKGGEIITPVSDLTDDTDYQNFLNKLPGSGHADETGLLSSNTARPQAEALLDAGYYFRGQQLPVSGAGPYTSPITTTCGKNVVILITNGLSNKDDDGALASLVGDQDLDGAEATAYGLGTHYLDDVAKFLHDSDNSSLDGDQTIETYTILAFQNSDPLVERAANASHGAGAFKNVFNSNELAAALTGMLVNIVLESDTSFVAPVVPTSPENRTYSGERVYLGFFKPISQKPWLGNLKKYGLDSQTNILDKNDNIATNSDGSFKDSSVSYWSTGTDGTFVDEGGAGELLRDRTLSTRLIYSNLSSELDLTHADNRFNDTNVSYTDLGVADATENTALINYVYGYDAYDDNGDGSTTDNRDWVLGDILHSKPQIVNYNTYTFSATNEANCSTNKTMIYVGTNDGMLHAFNDCDGTEAWAFIPDNLLPNLSALAERPAAHSYYVDASPVTYVYDKDKDGNIGPSEAADGDSDDGSADKVILIFGERRGGGAYYALNVTDPATPKYLWKIDSSTSGFGELGETWSEPQFGKVKYDDGSSNIDKIVAFVGAGYDSDNEDGRYGNTQGFTNADVASTTTIGDGAVTSTETVIPARDASSYLLTNDPVGRGVYAFEVATLDSSGVPTVPTSPVKLWDFTYSTSGTNAYNKSRLIYSIASDVTVLDTDYDGYTDRLYTGDTGGQMWRISEYQTDVSTELRPVANAVINDWFGKRLFEANAASTNSTDKGRKFFYRSSVTLETGGVVNLYIGSGDRAHPLNTAVTDRIYAIYDRGQRTNEEIDEDDLVDVTTDILQVATTSAADIATQITALAATSNYGWYIKLDRLNDDNLHAGEKILASALAFNKVAYYTSYTPNTSFSTDPCSPGNLGLSRLYGVDYKTGEAVLNFSSANDSESTADNTRALSKDGKVLRRADREVTLGVGIPSGLVVVMPSSGDAKLLIGCGGGLCSEDPVTGGTIIPIYWMNW